MKGLVVITTAAAVLIGLVAGLIEAKAVEVFITGTEKVDHISLLLHTSVG